MNQLSNYIIEKLRINKDTQVKKDFDVTNFEKIITWLYGKYANWSVEDLYSQIFSQMLIDLNPDEFKKFIKNNLTVEFKFELTKNKLIFTAPRIGKITLGVTYDQSLEDAIYDISI